MKKSTYLNNNSIIDTSDNRQFICKYIKNNPGIHLRKIVKDLALPMGLTQYHLEILQKEGLVRSMKLGMYRHYYSADINDEKCQVILAFLMPETARTILVYLIEHPGSTQGDIAKFKQVSAPTINWYMSKLISAGVVISIREGRIIRYFLQDVGYLIHIVRNYYPNVWNGMASKLVEMLVRVSSVRRTE